MFVYSLRFRQSGNAEIFATVAGAQSAAVFAAINQYAKRSGVCYYQDSILCLKKKREKLKLTLKKKFCILMMPKI